MRGSFEGLEQEDVNKHVQRVNEAIDNELADITSKVNDWAKPGQELDVVRLAGLLDAEKARPSDQRGNKLADLLANLDVNVFLWTDSRGNILWGWRYNEGTQELDLVSKSLKEELNPISPLLQHPQGEGTVKGLLLLPEDPMLVVSAPILYPVGDGLVENGSMIMGKYLDQAEVDRLGELTRLVDQLELGDQVDQDGRPITVDQLEMKRAVDPELPLPQDFKVAFDALSPQDVDIHVNPLEDDVIAGYTLQSDINGGPGLLWQVAVPRDIMGEGNKSLNFMLIALIAVGMVLVVVIAFLLDKLVLSRMSSLNNQVSGINTQSDLTTRVAIPGNDELSNLGGAINGMLGDIQTERGRSESLLLNVLPEPIAGRLKEGETTIADTFSEVSVLFSDVVGFTKLSARISATELVNMLNLVFSAFDGLTDKYRLEKIKTIGDAYMVVGGLPEPRPDHAEAIANMAMDMYTELYRINAETGTSLNIRIGIHSGPVVAGVIGTKKFIYDLWGDTVNTAARMESHGVEGRVHTTLETYELLKVKFDFDDRGIIDVKGKGDMHTYLLKGSLAEVGEASVAIA